MSFRQRLLTAAGLLLPAAGINVPIHILTMARPQPADQS